MYLEPTLTDWIVMISLVAVLGTALFFAVKSETKKKQRKRERDEAVEGGYYTPEPIK